MNIRIASRLLASLGWIVMASNTVHAGDMDDFVKYRKNVMEANGGLMGATNAILQGKVDKKGQLATYAKALEGLNQDLASLFPKGSNGGDTDALPEVWSKRAEFERHAKDTQEKAASFAKATAGKEAQARFKDLSESCKSCHKDFRK
jgi:cytochrome c556